MNEDIKKYEAQKSTSHKEDKEKQKKTNKRKINYRWVITFFLILISSYLGGAFEEITIGTTFFDNVLGQIFTLFSIIWVISLFIWVISLIFIAIVSGTDNLTIHRISFSKILMWLTVIAVTQGLFRVYVL